MHCHTIATGTPWPLPPCMRALVPGHDMDNPAELQSEPASPPHSDAMGNAGLARGVGVAADSGSSEGVGLMGADEGLDEE